MNMYSSDHRPPGSSTNTKQPDKKLRKKSFWQKHWKPIAATMLLLTAATLAGFFVFGDEKEAATDAGFDKSTNLTVQSSLEGFEILEIIGHLEVNGEIIANEIEISKIKALARRVVGSEGDDEDVLKLLIRLRDKISPNDQQALLAILKRIVDAQSQQYLLDASLKCQASPNSFWCSLIKEALEKYPTTRLLSSVSEEVLEIPLSEFDIRGGTFVLSMYLRNVKGIISTKPSDINNIPGVGMTKVKALIEQMAEKGVPAQTISAWLEADRKKLEGILGIKYKNFLAPYFYRN